MQYSLVLQSQIMNREIANLVAQQVPFQDPAVAGRVFQSLRRVKGPRT